MFPRPLYVDRDKWRNGVVPPMALREPYLRIVDRVAHPRIKQDGRVKGGSFDQVPAILVALEVVGSDPGAPDPSIPRSRLGSRIGQPAHVRNPCRRRDMV